LGCYKDVAPTTLYWGGQSGGYGFNASQNVGQNTSGPSEADEDTLAVGQIGGRATL